MRRLAIAGLSLAALIAIQTRPVQACSILRPPDQQVLETSVADRMVRSSASVDVMYLQSAVAVESASGSFPYAAVPYRLTFRRGVHLAGRGTSTMTVVGFLEQGSVDSQFAESRRGVHAQFDAGILTGLEASRPFRPHQDAPEHFGSCGPGHIRGEFGSLYLVFRDPQGGLLGPVVRGFSGGQNTMFAGPSFTRLVDIRDPWLTAVRLSVANRALPASSLRPVRVLNPSPGQRSATSSGAIQRVVNRPRWLTRPTFLDFARHYPRQALEEGIRGRAVLRCQVGDRGQLSGCSTISETPAGFGFGAAALRLSRIFTMSDVDTEGQPTRGGTVRVPVDFMIPQ